MNINIPFFGEMQVVNTEKRFRGEHGKGDLFLSSTDGCKNLGWKQRTQTLLSEDGKTIIQQSPEEGWECKYSLPVPFELP